MGTHAEVLHPAPTHIVQGEAARHLIARGAEVLARAAGPTVGPRGKNAVIATDTGPLVTNDGATIADAFTSSAAYRIGIDLLKSVAQKVESQAGDGTTTTIILGAAMMRAGYRAVAAGAHPREVQRGMNHACTRLVHRLHSTATPILSEDDLCRVATISCGDESIGELIGRAFADVGTDGMVTVEASTEPQTTLRFIDGMTFPQGYLSEHFVPESVPPASSPASSPRSSAAATPPHDGPRNALRPSPHAPGAGESASASSDNAQDESPGTVRLVAPYVCCYDGELSRIDEMLPLLEKVRTAGQPLVLFVRGMSGEALSMLALNAYHRVFPSVAVAAPGYGTQQSENLADIAALCGATVISPTKGDALEKATLEALGRAEWVRVTARETVMNVGYEHREAVALRIRQLRRESEAASHDYDRDRIQERLARLAGSIAVIRVGAPSEVEKREKLARAQDAVRTVQAAIRGGTIPGGGASLVHASLMEGEQLPSIHDYIDGYEVTEDFRTGMRIVYEAAREPMKSLAAAAGLDPQTAVARVQSAGEGMGINGRTGCIASMVDEGIIDPEVVTESALVTAVSLASMMVTTEVVILDKEKSRGL